MERAKKILTLCIALATLVFYCANGGENAPFGVQCLTVAGIVAAIMVAVSITPQSNSES